MAAQQARMAEPLLDALAEPCLKSQVNLLRLGLACTASLLPAACLTAYTA